MKLKCGHCQHQMEISDSRLPAGAFFKVKCPKCSEPITGKGPPKAQAVSEAVAEVPVPLPPTTVKEDAIASSAEWERLRPFVEAYVNERISILFKELEASGSQPKRADSVSQQNLQPFNGNKRALVCEGNSKIEQAVSSSLSKMGYSLDKVKSTKDALKKMEETMYELNRSRRIDCR